MLEVEEEKTISTEEPEQITSECGEERYTEKNEGHPAPPMDYILVNHEENSPPQPEACESRESTSQLEELQMDSKETGLLATQLANLSDTCQLASLKERNHLSAERPPSKDGEKSSFESPGQDQSWMVLVHSEVGESSSEMRDTGPGQSGQALEPASGHSLGTGPQMQVLGEMKPVESLPLEEASGLGSQSQKSKSRGRAGPDAVMLQPVTHDNEWEMLSPQPSQKNIIPETEIEEETEFLEPRTRKPRPNG